MSLLSRRQVTRLPMLALAAPTPPLQPLNRFSHMVQEHFVTRLRAIEDASLRRQAALTTRAAAQAYVAHVRKEIRRAFGPSPARTPLAPRITGRLERDGYVVEKVIYESRPGFLVTANLYLPRTKDRRPAVLGVCGHSDAGKAAAPYQSFAQGLARLGYVVLIIDPIGQGERSQYGDKPSGGVREHLLAGNQQFLVGEFLGAWRAWDGIRGLDYLLSRPEVDARHIGVTGNSGGGTLTTWIVALDERITMAAPSCFVTTFRRNLENELPADTEQCPPGVLAAGLDHADFIAAMAPRPVILLGKKSDFFDPRGTAEAFRRLRRIYKLLGAEDRIQMVLSPGQHGYAQDSRTEMYRWFNRWTKVSSAQDEPTLQLEPEATLRCTESGQVATLGSRTVFSFTKATAEERADERAKKPLAALVPTITDVLKLPKRSGAPDFRILRSLAKRNHPRSHAAVYAVETEPGVQALLYRLSQESLESPPPPGPPRAILYAAHMSSDAELREEPLVRELVAAEPDVPFYACDVRGIGESRPDTGKADSFLDPYGSDYFYAIHSLMLDRPYVGQRTHDLLAVLDLLGTFGHEQVHLVGRGWGSLPATFAALVSPRVVQVTLKNALTSYRDVATTERYHWPLSSFIPDVVGRFDLPDCYRALAGKKLRQIEPSPA